MRSLIIAIKTLLFAAIIGLLAGGIFIYSGAYPIGADVPHNKLTYWLLETLRERSVARASRYVDVPENLDTPERLLAGGADYNDMCSGCHLKPGKTESDFSQGLYPSPPNLALSHDSHGHDHGDAAEPGEDALKRQFWIIKHGIKASGMPAWGPTHSDERIWNMVAFLQRLPELTENQYQILSSRGNLAPH